MIAVLDTSALQAIHRAGVLEHLNTLFDQVLLPGAVERQTRDALRDFGPALVPDLDSLPWIAVQSVATAELEAHRDPPNGVKRRGLVSKTRPLCHGYAVDLEEFEVVVLARRVGGVGVLDDHGGHRCAANLGVTARTTIQVLEEIVARGLTPVPVADLVKKIQATGYDPTTRRP